MERSTEHLGIEGGVDKLLECCRITPKSGIKEGFHRKEFIKDVYAASFLQASNQEKGGF